MLDENRLSRLTTFIAEGMGLSFPRERWSDLDRSLSAAATAFGFAETRACADWLLSAPLSPDRLKILAAHLTVGETYFFRDRNAFRALSERVLPELIQDRLRHNRTIRIWSAGCCTGEEPYSIAIAIKEILPDAGRWNVSILATDINPFFLERAVKGSYKEWSFRDVPCVFKERYFRETDGRYAILPEIRAMVTFAHLNLVDDVYPSLATGTNAMDLVFCRNVLMYFRPDKVRSVVEKIDLALAEGGYVVVSPSEASKAFFPTFTTCNFPGAIFYRKDGSHVVEDAATFSSNMETMSAPGDPKTTDHDASLAVSEKPPLPAKSVDLQYERALALYEAGHYAEALQILGDPQGSFIDPKVLSLTARAAANLADLDGALAACEQWILKDRLDSRAHYLRAVILMEKGRHDKAQESLHRSLYLDPDFILGYFTLGSLARLQSSESEAIRNFQIALRLLSRSDPDAALPESDGLTARRLIETITALTSEEQLR